jgi:hypothetical protein
VFEADGLGAGPHTMTITSTGTRNPQAGSNRIEIDAIEAVTLLEPAAPPVELDRFEQGDARLSFVGGWVPASGGSYSGGSTTLSSGGAGDSVTFTFTGDAVRWIALKGVNRGIGQVTINDNPPVSVDLYQPTNAFQAVVFEADGLGAGPHTMTITSTGTRNPQAGSNRIEIDAIEAVTLLEP